MTKKLNSEACMRLMEHIFTQQTVNHIGLRNYVRSMCEMCNITVNSTP